MLCEVKMSIASAITTKQQQVADSYTAVSNKGGTLPQTQNLTNLATAISSIPSGSSGEDDEYANYIKLENIIKGTSYIEADEVEAACDDISMFLYGTLHS